MGDTFRADVIADEMDAEDAARRAARDTDRVKALRDRQARERREANAARERKFASIGTADDLNALDADRFFN